MPFINIEKRPSWNGVSFVKWRDQDIAPPPEGWREGWYYFCVPENGQEVDWYLGPYRELLNLIEELENTIVDRDTDYSQVVRYECRKERQRIQNPSNIWKPGEWESTITTKTINTTNYFEDYFEEYKEAFKKIQEIQEDLDQTPTASEVALSMEEKL